MSVIYPNCKIVLWDFINQRYTLKEFSKLKTKNDFTNRFMLKGSDRLCMVVELSMQNCTQIL